MIRDLERRIILLEQACPTEPRCRFSSEPYGTEDGPAIPSDWHEQVETGWMELDRHGVLHDPSSDPMTAEKWAERYVTAN